MTTAYLGEPALPVTATRWVETISPSHGIFLHLQRARDQLNRQETSAFAQVDVPRWLHEDSVGLPPVSRRLVYFTLYDTGDEGQTGHWQSVSRDEQGNWALYDNGSTKALAGEMVALGLAQQATHLLYMPDTLSLSERTAFAGTGQETFLSSGTSGQERRFQLGNVMSAMGKCEPLLDQQRDTFLSCVAMFTLCI
jgi:hypothetical protein